MSYNYNKRDGNEPQIIEFYESIRAGWHRLPAGAGRDLDVTWRGTLYVVEVKISKNERLTRIEKEFQAWCKTHNIPYNIVWDIESAGNAIGLGILSIA